MGYCFDLASQILKHKLKSIIEARKNRAAGMVKKLNNLGYGISMEDVRELAGSNNIGRPHIATALKEKGYMIAEKLNLLVTGGSDYHGNESEYLPGQIRLPYDNVRLLLRCNT